MQQRLERFADLIVNFGANVQPGQILDIGTGLGKEELTRALTASAYRRGAKFVDVYYWDPHLKRARVQYAAEDDLDPERLGRDVFPRVKEWTTVINERTVNWCVAPGPSAKWAQLVHPDLDADAALEKLWQQVEHVCRLDEADPEAAWHERSAALKGVARRLTERRFDAIHLEGGGTDLTVGLLPTSRWIGGGEETIEGVSHMANLPTEEVFTSPDPERVDGIVRATKPLYTQGRIIDGLTVRFEGGRAVQIGANAEADAEILRTLVAHDDGGTRLGELALVDREGRIGPLDTVFYDTLLDENAASHVALGTAYETAAGEEDRERLNQSSIHIDFMIGSAEVP